MSLTIKENNGVFLVEGAINSTTSNSFKMHMESLFQNNKELVINIDRTTEIDTIGVSVLKSLYMYSLHHTKEFYITGNGCKELFHDFSSDNAA
jgi:anti-anti-sigma regulatory factor